MFNSKETLDLTSGNQCEWLTLDKLENVADLHYFNKINRFIELWPLLVHKCISQYLSINSIERTYENFNQDLLSSVSWANSEKQITGTQLTNQISENTDVVKGALSSLRQFLATESPLKVIRNAFYFTLTKLFSFSRYLNFCLEFSVMLRNGLIRKIRFISKLMTSQPGQETVSIHMLINIWRRKTIGQRNLVN